MSRDTSFYYSFLVLPPQKRRAIVAVWDFCRAVDDAVDEVVPVAVARVPRPSTSSGRGPHRARLRGGVLARPEHVEGRSGPTGAEESDEARLRAADPLAMWRAELDACYSGRAPGTTQGKTLQPHIREFNLPRAPFEDLIDGVAMDVSHASYPTFEALAEYCRRVASTVGLICIEIFGYRDPATRTYAVNLGMALQLTNIIRDVAADLRQGRLYVPVEDLVRFGVTEEALRAGQVTPPVRELLRYECARARDYYRRAAADLPAVDAGSLVAAEIMGGIYFEILQRIERAGYDVFRRRIRVPRPYRALIALRIWARTMLRRTQPQRKLPTSNSQLPKRRAQSPKPRAPLTPDVIVIGAGFAGLSAATALAERGGRVLVVEARPTLGGRATAFTDPATGERVDNGQHVLFGCYHETFRFLRRIGAESNVRVQRNLAVDMIDRAGRWSRLACPALPSPFHLLAGVMTWKALGWRDRLVVLRMRAPIAAARAQHPYDIHVEETVRQWLVRHGQTTRLIELLWEPLAVAALNQPIDSAAAAPFASVLARLFGRDPRDAALALPLKPLDELYARPAREYIERQGGAVRTLSPATISCPASLDGSRGGSAPHRAGPGGGVRDGDPAEESAPQVVVRGERLTARSIICTAPWYALSDVFPDRPAALAPVLDAAARTAASPIVTVNLWFDRVVTERMLVGLPGRTMQWVFDKRTVFGEQASHLSLVSSGADEVVSKSNQELIELAVGEVRDALPAARAAALLRGVVVREKRATFSVAPGQPPRPSTRTGVSGLFLAGDWIGTGLPATIEGAVLSGHLAADMAAAHLRI